MDVIKEEKAFEKRLEPLVMAYSNIPEPPDESNYVLYHKCALQIVEHFKLGPFYLHLCDEHLKLNDRSGANNCPEKYNALAISQRKDIDELERAMSESDLPKITLSKGVKGKK